MIVTVWRHGQAGSAFSDRERRLTGEGADDVGFGCQQFHELCNERGIPHPDHIFYSNWVRTTQTADIIASAFTHASAEPCVALVPGSTPADAEKLLDELLATDPGPVHVVLVSHQPLVSRLVDYLLENDMRVPSLNPGALVSLQLTVAARGCGELLFWSLPPGYEAHV